MKWRARRRVRWRGRRRSRWRGQGLVEFALILPLLLFIFFFIIAVARLLHAYLEVENGARFGVRYAVTGEYNSVYCAGFPGGVCDSQAEMDAARIPSIKDAARAGSESILRDETLSAGQPGFFTITVCSNKGGVIYFPSDSNTATPADCQPTEDGGGPGDRVSVTVDFDHPLIVPILSTWWPSLHLTAKREGIVEQFRTSRVVGLPATIAVPTFTPTASYTPSITPTPSDTPTPTDTSTPTETPTPTQTFTPTPTFTPSLTPTTTSSPTLTPTPDCSLLSNAGMTFYRYYEVRLSVRNSNPIPMTLTNAYMDWTKAYSSQYVDWFRFNGNRFYGGNDSAPPTSHSASVNMNGGGATADFQARFGGVPSNLGLDGTFTIVLTFNGTCTVSGVISRTAPTVTPTLTPSLTPTPSNTPTPSRTPTITRTPTRTLSPTPSKTPTKTRTPTITLTPSKTLTPSRTPTPSKTPTRTPTRTRTPSRTPTVGSTPTTQPSNTPTKTATPPAFG